MPANLPTTAFLDGDAGGATAALLLLGLVALLVVSVLRRVERRLERTTRKAEQTENERRGGRRVRFARALVLGALFSVSALLLAQRWSPFAWAFAAALSAAIFWAIRGIAEDVVAGLVVALTRPFSIGDWIIVGESHGAVTRLGIRHVRLRSRDESEVQIPYRTLLATPLVNVSRSTNDVPIEISLPLESKEELRGARARAALCAATSPFASLHRSPETFLVAPSSDGDLSIRVRGYVFDVNYAEAFRSHIVEAWIEASCREDDSELADAASPESTLTGY